MMLAFTAVGLMALTVVAVVVRRNELRTVAITLLAAYLVLTMTLGYTAAAHRAVEGFDKYGEETARHMINGVHAYNDALSDARLGIALASLGLLVLGVTGRQRVRLESNK